MDGLILCSVKGYQVIGLKYGFYEFFAGGGMARAGLGNNWRCLLANDCDAEKAESYCRNWGGSEFLLSRVEDIVLSDVPAGGDLAWASFPCQDLSLAGNGKGLSGARSGVFWPYWKLIEAMEADGRAPSIVVLENVTGALTSHGGRDFAAIIEAIVSLGYKVGALIIDAVLFVPQSRPRLFIVGVKGEVPASLHGPVPDPLWGGDRVRRAYEGLSPDIKRFWRWWWLPHPPARHISLIDILEDNPHGVEWHSREETDRLLSMMSAANLMKIKTAKRMRRPVVGAIFRRTRIDGSGRKVQRAEVRFDGVAGCLRTPGGGSSRQIIMMVNGDDIRSRLLSPRETARLMGLPDSYILPENRNAAYHLTGDGLVVPVVRWLAENLLEPLIAHLHTTSNKAA